MKIHALLYSSASIHERIKRLFSEPGAGDKRVALVAFVGSDGERYLPHPKGLRLICNPSPGGTDPDTLRNLIKRGATVEISDSLHMKVYWSKNRGCVIASANASSSALGRNGLKEAGIWLPAGAVNINRLIQYANPREVKQSDLRKLDTQTRRYAKNVGRNRKEKKTAQNFLEWYVAPHRSNWKICWTDHEVAGTAKRVKEQTASEYGHKKPHTWATVGKNRVHPSDWLLSFMFSKRGIRSIEWKYVDFVIKISPKEKHFYERNWPYHAVQVNPDSNYPLPPFEITKRFRKALAAAIRIYTPERVQELKTDNPPERLLDLIAREIKSL